MPVKIKVGQTYPTKNEGKVVVLREMKFTNRNLKRFPFLCAYMAPGATEEQLLYYSENGVCSTETACDISDEKYGYVHVDRNGDWSEVFDTLEEMKENEGVYRDGYEFDQGCHGLKVKLVPIEEFHN